MTGAKVAWSERSWPFRTGRRVTVRGLGHRAMKHRHEDRWVFAGSTARTLGAALHAMAHKLERGATVHEKVAIVKLQMSSMYGKFGVSPESPGAHITMPGGPGKPTVSISEPTVFKTSAGQDMVYYDISSSYPAAMMTPKPGKRAKPCRGAVAPATAMALFRRSYRGYRTELVIDQSGATHVEVSSAYPASLLEGAP